MMPGLWRRTGMSGAICGLEWQPALQMIPAGADREAVISLLTEWEHGMLSGTAEERPKETPDVQRQPDGR